MTTETRVGIVAGLMIVVAASVYFFYGNDRNDDNILVATPTRVSLPPKIPPSADPPPTVTAKKPTAPQRVTRAPRRTPTAATSTDQLAQNRPPMRALPPTVQPKPLVPTHVPVAKAPDSPIVLRTSPSTELVAATRDNLREEIVPNSDNPPMKPRATPISPPQQPAPRSTPKIVSEATMVIDLTPTRTSSDSARPSLREMPRENWAARKHTVVEGDTPTDISKQYFGDASRADDILAANPQIKSARHLKIGDVLTLPEPRGSGTRPTVPDDSARPMGMTASSPPSAARTYTVQSGDTLYSISRKLYGSSKRWEDIFRLNKAALKNNPARLSNGMLLKLPE